MTVKVHSESCELFFFSILKIDKSGTCKQKTTKKQKISSLLSVPWHPARIKWIYICCLDIDSAESSAFFCRTVNQRCSLTQCQRVEPSNQMNICDMSRRELKLRRSTRSINWPFAGFWYFTAAKHDQCPVTQAEQISLSWGGTIAAIQGENDSFTRKPKLGFVLESGLKSCVNCL